MAKDDENRPQHDPLEENSGAPEGGEEQPEGHHTGSGRPAREPDDDPDGDATFEEPEYAQYRPAPRGDDGSNELDHGFHPAYDASSEAVLVESEPPPWSRRMVHSVPYYVAIMSLIPAASLWAILAYGDSPLLVGICTASTAFGLLTVFLRIIRGSVLERFIRVRERVKAAAERTDEMTGILVGIQPSYRVAQHLWKNEVLLWETKQHQLSVIAKAADRLKRLVSTTFRKVLTGIAAFGLLMFVSNNRPAGITLVVMLVVGFVFYSVADWSADRYALTNERVMAVKGLITAGQPAMPRTRITDINATVTTTAMLLAWLGWIELPYGTLIFESAGGEQALREVYFVPCAMAVSAALMMAKTPS